MRYLNFSNSFFSYANQAVYPFYILHQMVMLVIGYYIVQWDRGIVPKFLAVAMGMFVITMILYELLVRRWAVTRFLFGLKPLTRPETAKADLTKA